MITESLKKYFEAGLEYQGIEYTQEQVIACLNYIELLQKWNRVFNLTSIKIPKDMIQLHLLDSLAIIPQLIEDCHFSLDEQKVADVGTGAGLPGVPLAIFFPQHRFTLIDAREKKIKFLNQVKSSLKLDNISPIHCRVESYPKAGKFDLITTRAFSSMKDMLEITQHLCHTNGLFLAMKGRQQSESLADIASNIKWLKTQELSVYQLNASRCTVLFQKL